jgi:hypothetical protein
VPPVVLQRTACFTCRAVPHNGLEWQPKHDPLTHVVRHSPWLLGRVVLGPGSPARKYRTTGNQHHQRAEPNRLRRSGDGREERQGRSGRKEEVVTREYTINLHKRLHGWYFISLLLFPCCHRVLFDLVRSRGSASRRCNSRYD